MPFPPNDSRFEIDTEAGRWWIPLLFVLVIAAWYSYQVYQSTHQPLIVPVLEECPVGYYLSSDTAGNLICVSPPKGT